MKDRILRSLLVLMVIGSSNVLLAATEQEQAAIVSAMQCAAMYMDRDWETP